MGFVLLFTNTTYHRTTIIKTTMKILRTPESSHWYHRDGTPCHEVTAKTTGLPRPTTVADARKLDLIPSVTNILNMKAKPGLDTWKQDNAIRAALSTPRNPDEPEEQWHSRIAEESDRIGREAAEWGTLIHEQIEQYNTQGAFLGTGEILQYVEGYAKWHRENVEATIFAERSVVGTIGYAGRLDLYAMMKNGRRAVIDFKSQKVVGKKGPNFYKDWAIQLAAYAAAIKEPDDDPPDLISVVIPSDAPGPCFECRWFCFDEAWRAFVGCFDIWCFEKGYRPGDPSYKKP